jgi:hypothetical protein
MSERDGKEKRKKKIKKVGPTFLEGGVEGLQEWRLGGEFGGTCKIEVHLEALLELCFYTKPPKFGVEAHMEAPTGVALSGDH